MVEPRRVALGLLTEAGWLEHPGAAACRAAFAPGELPLLLQALAGGCNAPRTSSLGRLFDGAASLLDLVQELSYEGQAGLLLEGLAGRHPPRHGQPRPHIPIHWRPHRHWQRHRQLARACPWAGSTGRR